METVSEYRSRRRQTIADNIRRLLNAQDRSAYWLARQVDLPEKYADKRMSDYLHARHEPGVQRLQKIAAALGVTVDELLADEEVAA